MVLIIDILMLVSVIVIITGVVKKTNRKFMIPAAILTASCSIAMMIMNYSAMSAGTSTLEIPIALGMLLIAVLVFVSIGGIVAINVDRR